MFIVVNVLVDVSFALLPPPPAPPFADVLEIDDADVPWTVVVELEDADVVTVVVAVPVCPVPTPAPEIPPPFSPAFSTVAMVPPELSSCILGI
jgi:hypothetical protein